MTVAFDNTFLSLVFNPDTKPRPNPITGSPVDYCIERIDDLIDFHNKNGSIILIPTPCLSELLTAVPDSNKIVTKINNSNAFRLVPFDSRCAIELAEETRKAIDMGDKKSGVKSEWQKIKLDRQIAIIAKVNNAGIFYTDDDTQTKFATMIGMDVKHTWDLKLIRPQTEMFNSPSR